MARRIRKPFNVDGPFVVRRRFLVSGQFTVPNGEFWTEGLDNRRIRQMYDNRMIDMASEQDIERWKSQEIVYSVKDVEKRIKDAEGVDWKSLNRLELIEYVRETTGILCKSKKEATETMEKWEAK